MSFKEEILQIQETFGMSKKKIAEILELKPQTFRNYLYVTPEKLTADHVLQLKRYIVREARRLTTL